MDDLIDERRGQKRKGKRASEIILGDIIGIYNRSYEQVNKIDAVFVFSYGESMMTADNDNCCYPFKLLYAVPIVPSPIRY